MSEQTQERASSAQPPRVYSYVRFSTPEQRGGDSLRRQTAAATAWATQHGLELDTALRLTDEGLSAFRGKHVAEGRLGAFLEAVKAGEVPQGSVLFVESLDRLSRQEVKIARNLLESILEAGVDVVAGGHWFKRDKYELVDMIVALVGFERATEESKVKATRIRAVWDAKRERARADRTPMGGKVPAWLRLGDDGKFAVIPEREAVVKRIFDLARRGVGLHSIVRKLTEEEVPTFGRSQWWNRSAIAKILCNPAAVGTLVPHEVSHVGGKRARRPVGEPVLNYYPVVVSEVVWSATQLYRGSRGSVPLGGRVQNLFGGLLRCDKCGTALSRRDKGARSKPKLVCERKRRSGWDAKLPGGTCDAPSLSYEAFEARALAVLPGLLADVHLIANTGLHWEMDEAEAEAAACDVAIARIVSAIERGGDAPALTHRLTELQKERDTYAARLGKLRAEVARVASPGFRKVAQWLTAVDLKGDRGATALRLRTAVRAIRVNTETGEVAVDWIGGASESGFKL